MNGWTLVCAGALLTHEWDSALPLIWQSIRLHNDVSTGVILIALPHGPKTVTSKTLVRAGTEVYLLLDCLALRSGLACRVRSLPVRDRLPSALNCWLLMRKCNSSVGSWKRFKKG